ncbi:DUF6249 domain-containing protein [Paracnuella aquatica]|uniref:DUF6249 domain-containing protein n=1 Tax=Paracnuella aquatica TaxID=2268757 RepID=UPI000DEF9774|nr:DUF6249 domain-containing protein [Paracnuella aquatica]RPD51445.1 hypothetical protein DRJ53_01825 [Paracnuella aquatica]
MSPFLIPIITSLGAFAMVFGIVYLKTKENMAMIEKGMNPKQFANRPAPYRSLKSGLVFFGAGIGLLLAFFLDKNMGSWGNEPIYFALIAIGSGIGLMLSYRIEKKETLTPNREVEPARREPEYR